MQKLNFYLLLLFLLSHQPFRASNQRTHLEIKTCILLAQTLHFFKVMNLTELSIIYLACGAPFGVYYFFQQRENQKLWQKSPLLWLKCVLIPFFWFPFALRLLQRFVTKKFRSNEFVVTKQTDSTLTAKIDDFENSFAQFLLAEKTGIPLFHLRETFQRYVGLTLGNLEEGQTIKNDINELFQITQHENAKLATICLNRRNRLQLETHQTLARKDFLRIIKKINSCLVAKEKLSSLAFEFAKIINDDELAAELRQIFENSTQTENTFTVKKMENEVWNPIEHKQLPTNQAALNLPAIPARAMMSKQD